MSVTVVVHKIDGDDETLEARYCKPKEGFFEVVMAVKPQFKARYFPAAQLAPNGIEVTSDPKDDNDAEHERGR